MQETYTVPEENLDRLQTRVGEINKRCAKLGVPPITLTVGEVVKTECEYLIERTNGDEATEWRLTTEPAPTMKRGIRAVTATGCVRNWRTVVVEGETPKLAGWKFVATLEPLDLEDGGQENMVLSIPGATVPDEFRSRIGECDHCKLVRGRRQTFVLQHEDGRYVCLGRQCIKDFLGGVDPHAVARQAEWLAALANDLTEAETDKWMNSCRGVERPWSLQIFLSTTAAVVRQQGGFVSRAAVERALEANPYRATKSTTSGLVVAYIAGRTQDDRQLRQEVGALTDEDRALAENMITWARDVNVDGSDYLANVNLLTRVGTVNYRTAGVAASIYTAYKRATEPAPIYPERAEPQHVGTVGQKIELTVTVEWVRELLTQYGTTGLHSMVTPDGNRIKWFASGANWLVEGGSYKIRGTVKGHGEWKDKPETTLTRVKVVEEVVS